MAVERALPRFPRRFMLGAATAAHQVEGGNVHSDWWEAEAAGRLPFRSGASCNHYERFESDFDLLRDWRHDCHRFSIEWSRIEPREGDLDDAALEHYRRVIAALRARNLEPIPTLSHFTLPAWLARRGGWLAPDAPEKFSRFVERIVAELGADVRFWITVNEPVVLVMQGYLNGEWPPFVQRSPVRAWRALRALVRAHRAAHAAIKAQRPEALVGLAHSAMPVEPCDPESLLDRSAARLRGFAWNHLLLRLLGASRGKPPRDLDFIGLNYYTRSCVKARGPGAGLVLGRACREDHHRGQGPRTALGWEVYPRGLGIVLREFSRYGLPLFVTENGVATDDDELRCRYLVEHLEELERALASGLRVMGYLHWTMMDNYEWHLGTGAKYGLAAIDPVSGARRPKRSAGLFANCCTVRA